MVRPPFELIPLIVARCDGIYGESCEIGSRSHINAIFSFFFPARRGRVQLWYGTTVSPRMGKGSRGIMIKYDFVEVICTVEGPA